MSKDLIEHSSMSAIGNAIRQKLGVGTTYKPSQMPAAIASIPAGYPEPTGTISITQNGTVNVKDYASASVNVAGVNPVSLSGLEQGGVQVNLNNLWVNAKDTIAHETHAIRVRSASMIGVTIGATYTVSISDGYHIYCYFQNDQCVGAASSAQWAASQTFTAAYPYFTVIIRKDDNSAITPSSGFVVSFAES